MFLLLLVSLIWAFSFGLVKSVSELNSAFVAAARLGLALLVLLPFLRWRGLTVRLALSLVGIGAVQFGVMYLAYNQSFHYLKSYEVALFTLTTPILVTLIADAFDGTLRACALLAAAIAVVGAGCVVYRTAPTSATFAGIALVQLSNLAFALGQVFYRRLRLEKRHAELRDREIFALLYAGGFAVALAVLLRTGGTVTLNGDQLWRLVYLGTIASGLGFFLWNLGATRVNPGVLATMNNAKIPLAVACSLLVFGEHASVPRLLISGILMLFAVWLAEHPPKKPAA